jgi:hypothetical protein
VPFVFDAPAVARSKEVVEILAEAARQIQTLAIVPLASALRFSLVGPHVVPLVSQADWNGLDRLPAPPAMIALDGWDRDRCEELKRRFPEALVAVRIPADADVQKPVEGGVRILHLVADHDGRAGGSFVLELIRQGHERLVEAGVREEVTLIGSGGIVMAEHVPKAIACGLDAVGLDLALLVALQGRFDGAISFPALSTEWGVQRVKNLAASWRDQLLEVLGAMGLREVRRLRGELGRCMFAHELEREAFDGIDGYEP